MNRLGCCYSDGKGVNQDYLQVAEYYQKSSELGNSNAMNKLGSCYSDSEGVEQDYYKYNIKSNRIHCLLFYIIYMLINIMILFNISYVQHTLKKITF